MTENIRRRTNVLFHPFKIAACHFQMGAKERAGTQNRSMITDPKLLSLEELLWSFIEAALVHPIEL